jgi:Holliday junction resolvasome RuvABC DNA-binding subunit
VAAKKTAKKKAVHTKTMNAMMRRKGVGKKAAAKMARRAAGKC